MLHDEIQLAARQLEREIASGPIVPSVTPQEIRHHLTSRYDFRAPRALDEIVTDVERMLRTWQVHVTHPRYLGLFNPSVVPESIVADTLVAMYNPQLATWRTSPAANEIERHTLLWLAAKFGFPADSAVNFTTGGAEANFSALIVALSRAFPDYGEAGIASLAKAPTLYLTGEAHHAYNRIAHMAGLGRRALRIVATDGDLKMDVGDLARQVNEDRKNGFAPLLVVGTAGTTAAGVIDPLADLSRFCRAEDLWLHVDAAWGGAAVLSPLLKRYLAGIESADSITCDAHKWFSVPMGAGMFFCRHAEAIRRAFDATVGFMPAATPGDTTDPYNVSVQWSRRFIGLKLFFALAQRGESGYAAMIEHQAAMGDLMRDLLTGSGWQVLNKTPLPLVCFTREGLPPSAVVTNLLARQTAWVTEVQLRGMPAVRACITSFRTTEADINHVVGEMNRLVCRPAKAGQ